MSASLGVRSWGHPITWGGGLALLVLSIAFAFSPWIAGGVVLGGLLVFMTLRWSYVTVGLLLALGPFDLAFLTGGMRGLAPELGGIDMNGIRLAGVSLGLWLIVLFDPDLRRFLFSSSARWYLPFLGLALVTIPFSMHPNEGIRLWFKLAWPLLIFLIVARPGRSMEEVEKLADWILIGATAIIVTNPLFVLAGGYQVDFHGRIRFHGVGIHQNPFSFYLLTIGILALSRLVLRRQARYLFLIVGALFWIGLTLTRISVLAAAAALSAAVLYSTFVRRSSRLALGASGLLIILALLFAPMALERTFGEIPTIPELIELFRDPVLLYQAVNLEGRQYQWGLLYLAWAASPLLGHGLGSSAGILLSDLPSEFEQGAHNEFFRVGTDLGWLGIGLLILAAIGWVRVSWGRGSWALPAICSMIVWATVSLTDNPLDYYSSLTQFVGFMVAAAVVQRRLDRSPDSTPSQPVPE